MSFVVEATEGRSTSLAALSTFARVPAHGSEAASHCKVLAVGAHRRERMPAKSAAAHTAASECTTMD